MTKLLRFFYDGKELFVLWNPTFIPQPHGRSVQADRVFFDGFIYLVDSVMGADIHIKEASSYGSGKELYAEVHVYLSGRLREGK